MRVVYSRHIILDENKRDLTREWIERAALRPAVVRDDPNDATVRRHYVRIPEFGDRVLRAACRTEGDTVFVLTAFFDRNARRFV